MLQPESKDEARCRVRRWARSCAVVVVIVTIVAVSFDYGRFAEAFWRSPLCLFELPSVWFILGSFLVSGFLVLTLAYRALPNAKLRGRVWLLAGALCLCSLSAWFAVDQARRAGEEAFAAAAVILVLVSLPCFLLVLIGVPATVLYAIRRTG
jgi:uncharacterized BrkB/YihY/UPF0761 family membrane protein